jgi:hypothetical protein
MSSDVSISTKYNSLSFSQTLRLPHVRFRVIYPQAHTGHPLVSGSSEEDLNEGAMAGVCVVCVVPR